MNLVDQIIDIATQFPRDEARALIADLLEAGVEIRPASPPLTDKLPGKEIPITQLGLVPQGNYTDPQGRKATVYTTPTFKATIPGPPPTQPNRITNPNQADGIEKARKEMNDLSKSIVDKTMGKA